MRNSHKTTVIILSAVCIISFSGCTNESLVVNNYYIADSDVNTQSTVSETSITDISSAVENSVSSTTNIVTSQANIMMQQTDPNLTVGITYTVTGTTNYLALRNAPAYDGSNEIAKLNNGDEVTIQSQNVYGDNGDYCYIQVLSGSAKDKTGYVNKNYLKQGISAVSSNVSSSSNTSSKTSNNVSKSDSSNNSKTTPSETDSSGKTEVVDVDYPSVMRGNLTKEQLELVLSRVTNDMAQNGMSESDSKTMALYFANSIISSSDSYGLYNGGMEKHWAVMSVNDFNRLFSSFCDYKIDALSDYAYNSDTNGTYASDDTLYVALASTSDDANAEVTGAEYNGDELIIYYHYHYWRNGSSDIDENRKAVLHKSSDSLYKIDSIE